ncbi:MAG: sigma-70 family RNA polymerase sigma factor [Phycisphaeraceae bacterium]|nr:sigma-70 family RNA polymerase sigma factor [Phycisphaeraceae bacterium]
MAKRMLKDDDLADDLTQIVQMEVFERIQEFRGENERSFPAWVKRIAYSRITDERRRRKGPWCAVTDGRVFELLPSNGIGRNQEDFDDLIAVILQLKSDQRILLYWLFVLGETQEQIGERLGISQQSAHNRIKRVIGEVHSRMSRCTR